MKKIDEKLAQLLENTTQERFNVIIVFDSNTMQQEVLEKLNVLMSNIASATLSKQEITDLSTNTAIISIEHDGEMSI